MESYAGCSLQSTLVIDPVDEVAFVFTFVFFGFDGQLNDFLLDKVKAEPQLHRGESRALCGSCLEFIQKVIVYLGVKTEKILCVNQYL